MKIDIAPRGVATILFKNLWLFLGIVVLSVAASVLYLFLAANIYQADANLLVRFGSDVRPELQQDGKGSIQVISSDERREIIESNIRILQSRDFAVRLVNDFGVEKLYPEIVANPPKLGTATDAAVSQLMKDIATKAGVQTNVLQLTVFHRDRELAIKILQRLIDIFVEKQAQLYENPQIGFLKSQTVSTKATLDLLQDKLNQLRTQSGIYDYQQQFTLLLTQQQTVTQNMAAADARVAEAQARQARLETALGAVPASLTAMVGDGQMKALDDSRIALEALRKRANDNPGEADALRPQIADAEKAYQKDLGTVQALNRGGSSEVYQTILTDYLRTSAEADAGRSAIAYWNGQAQMLAQKISAMQQANIAIIDTAREVDIAENTYKALKRQAQDAAVSEKLNDEKITRVSMIDTPSADHHPARPRKFLIVLAALLGSILVAVALIVIKEGLSERIYLPDHIEENLGVNVLVSFGRARRRLAA